MSLKSSKASSTLACAVSLAYADLIQSTSLAYGLATGRRVDEKMEVSAHRSYIKEEQQIHHWLRHAVKYTILRWSTSVAQQEHLA